jgi:hypothetical protein
MKYSVIPKHRIVRVEVFVDYKDFLGYRGFFNHVNTAVVVLSAAGKGLGDTDDQVHEVEPPEETKLAEERVKAVPLSVIVVQPALEIGLADNSKTSEVP